MKLVIKIPLIKEYITFLYRLFFFSIIGLLVSIPIFNTNTIPEFITPYLNLGMVLILTCSLFYFRLSISIFIGMFFFSIVSLWGNHLIANHSNISLWKVSAIIFIVSWIFQFIGHKHEGEKPSFIKDIQFLLIGPVWILVKLYQKLGINY